ncbi:hypothetical protein FNZ56_12285 [Pseudoluteimonas lycopersici]|uniref:Uncharacterized protein n=1 Tax=Pseudoluteimonas lycopersici TaxID=1324796 RepID=A0A516V7W1_9GAMM|nr:hypothetical protein [Lysobacter lycopersici]QDQ74605.1 hypothetical protein FNZ56_12285 [Lysobacter lycopersici]
MRADTVRKNTKLFLEENGRPLAEFWSADYGLNKSDSIRFIDVVRQNNLNVLGVEVWRWKGNRYKMDSLMTWYAIETDVARNLEEVQAFVETVDLDESDLFAIQTS